MRQRYGPRHDERGERDQHSHRPRRLVVHRAEKEKRAEQASAGGRGQRVEPAAVPQHDDHGDRGNDDCDRSRELLDWHAGSLSQDSTPHRIGAGRW